jgi:hypothetical protein
MMETLYFEGILFPVGAPGMGSRVEFKRLSLDVRGNQILSQQDDADLGILLTSTRLVCSDRHRVVFLGSVI